MFERSKKRYLTKGVQSEIPLAFQMFIWNCVDTMPEPKDYLQIFKLNSVNGLQKIQHSSEQPKYKMEYIFPKITEPITAKVYVVDDGVQCTMLLSEEY